MAETEHQTDNQESTLERVSSLLDQLDTVLMRIDRRLQALVPPAAAAARPPARAPAAAVLTPQGDYWALAYGEHELLVKDCRGVQHLARLLARPNEEVHVLELVRGSVGGRMRRRNDDRPDGVEGAAGPVLDRTARAAYRRRLAELEADDDASDAEQWLERELLEAELRRATALHGRDRTFSDPVERARVAVTKAVRHAIRGVQARDAELGHHLERAVRTGTLCSYVVEPVVIVPTQRYRNGA